MARNTIFPFRVHWRQLQNQRPAPSTEHPATTEHQSTLNQLCLSRRQPQQQQQQSHVQPAESVMRTSQLSMVMGLRIWRSLPTSSISSFKKHCYGRPTGQKRMERRRLTILTCGQGTRQKLRCVACRWKAGQGPKICAPA